jgi:pimeloyl-ACP methyl ester carboxylesterase
MAQATRGDLLLVPGLLCTPALFAAQLAALSDRARITIADTTRAEGLPAIAAGILAAAPPRFALAGLSLGGYVAFEILRQAPERVTRLALIASNARADRPEQIKLRHLLIGMGRAMGLRAVQAALMGHLVHADRLADRALVDAVIAMADAFSQPMFERQQRAIMARPDNRPFLAEIRSPTLVVVGDGDRLTPPKVAEEMAAGIAGSRLVVIPSCGHLATMERPAAVNAALAEWLAD